MQTFNLSKYVTGDTWNGIPSIVINRNEIPLNLTNAYAEFNVRFQIDAPILLRLTTDDGTINIIDPVNGVLSIPPQIINIPPANYIWSLKVTLSSGEVDTFVSGKWNIIKTA
jgi:hypothetical protein